MLAKSLESLIIGVSIAAIPGPIFFELVRRTLTKGLFSGVLLVLGEFSGNFLLLLVIFFSTSHLLADHLARTVLFAMGSLVLVWVSVSAFRLEVKQVESSYNHESSNVKAESYIAGLGIAVTSPIVIALWISLSGSYLNALHDRGIAFLNVFLIASGFLLFFIPVALVLHHTRHRIPPKKVVALSKLFGLVLVVYAVVLAVQAF